MSSPAITAAAAGTWRLGDLTVNRLGFGAMRLTSRGPFGNGAPSDRGRAIAVLRRAVGLGVRHGATPAQVRLAWTLHQGPNVLAIPGTGNPEHLAENVAAGALRLTCQDLALLGS